MSAHVPAKSILKQLATQPSLSDEQKAKAEQDRRNLGIALRHANQIQYRKDIEARIFGNIETLLEFPSATPFSPSDAARFASLVRTFQPSDYDNLIEERRIDSKCGYCLCSNRPRSLTMGASAAWKLNAVGASDYCSDRCARKALYVKTQLSEVPAWERAAGQNPRVELDVADRRPAPTLTGVLPLRPRADQQVLAEERGENVSSTRPAEVMVATIVESRKAEGPSLHLMSQSGSHAAVEGYEPSSALPNMLAQQTHEITTRESSKAVEAAEEEESWRELFETMDER